MSPRASSNHCSVRTVQSPRHLPPWHAVRRGQGRLCHTELHDLHSNRRPATNPYGATILTLHPTTGTLLQGTALVARAHPVHNNGTQERWRILRHPKPSSTAALSAAGHCSSTPLHLSGLGRWVAASCMQPLQPPPLLAPAALPRFKEGTQLSVHLHVLTYGPLMRLPNVIRWHMRLCNYCQHHLSVLAPAVRHQ